MGRKPRRKRKAEFSKQILKVVAVGTMLIVLFSCVMVWKTQDLSPLGYLIPAVFAELAVGTAFYYNKSKAENEIKLKKLYGRPADDRSEEDAL